MKVIHRFKTQKGRRFRVEFSQSLQRRKEPLLGLIESDGVNEGLLRLASNMSDYQLMETVIHEMGHAFFWDESETNINQFAKATMTLLRRLGFVPGPNARLSLRS